MSLNDGVEESEKPLCLCTAMSDTFCLGSGEMARNCLHVIILLTVSSPSLDWMTVQRL